VGLFAIAFNLKDILLIESCVKPVTMKKVLVIENDKDLLDIVDYILIGCGLKVLSSRKRLNLEAIVDLNPDLLIIDHPLIDDLRGELCRELKSNELTKHIPIVLFSVEPNLKDVASKNCADAYIQKPFNLVHFEKIVEKLIA